MSNRKHEYYFKEAAIFLNFPLPGLPEEELMVPSRLLENKQLKSRGYWVYTQNLIINLYILKAESTI